MSWNRHKMCLRASKELSDGDYVNLGIGMPTQVANFISQGKKVTLQSENGMLGMGPFPKKGEEDHDPEAALAFLEHSELLASLSTEERKVVAEA